jgi:hypothetical protein
MNIEEYQLWILQNTRHSVKKSKEMYFSKFSHNHTN